MGRYDGGGYSARYSSYGGGGSQHYDPPCRVGKRTLTDGLYQYPNVQAKREGEQSSDPKEVQADKVAEAVTQPATADPATDALLPPNDQVETTWYVDYDNVCSEKKQKSKGRTDNDQLIVNTLKIDPAGKEAARTLSGGNSTDGGKAKLGNVSVPKGNVDVSASVSYADGEVQVFAPTKKQKEAEEAVRVRIQEGRIIDGVTVIEGQRGDYAAIAKEVSSDLGCEVKIVPTTKTKGLKKYNTPTVKCAVEKDSSWVATVHGDVVEEKTTFSQTKEHGKEKGQTVGVETKSTTATTVSEKQAEVTRLVEEFTTSVINLTREVFTLVESKLLSDTVTNTTTVDAKVNWKIGIGKDEKKEAVKEGLLSKILKSTNKAAKWLFKKIPIVGAGIDFLDGVLTRGYVERESSEATSERNERSVKTDEAASKEVSSLAEIATEVSAKTVNETSREFERAVATSLGLEIKGDSSESNKNTDKITDTIGTSTTVYSIRDPKLRVEEDK